MITDHLCEFRYSKDGGNNWSNWRTRSIGAVGQYVQRVRFKRLGQSPQWVFHVRVSSPQVRDMLDCTIDADASE